MFCSNCGNEVSADDKFCIDCGALQTHSAAQNGDTQPPEIPQKNKKSLKWLWITLASVVTVVALVFAAYFIFFRDLGSVALVGKALYNLGTEAEERFDHTPFKIFTTLGDVLEDGTLTTSFNYSTAIMGGFLNTDVDGTFILSSDLKERNFALEAQVGTGTFLGAVEFDAYINRERLALRLPVLDNNYYGITYDTFREDIRSFGNLLMLSDDIMDEFADYVDILNTALNVEVSDISDVDIQPVFSDAIKNFTANLEIKNRRTTINSGNESIRCRVVEFIISKATLLCLLDDIYNEFDSNEALQDIIDDIYGSIPFPVLFGNNSVYEQFSRDFRSFIEEFERSYSGDIVFAFYIGNKDRLLRAEINVDIEYDNNQIEMSTMFDFGKSIDDDWVMEIWTRESGSAENYSITWSYDKTSDVYTNSITIYTGTMDSFVLTSEWDINRGDFTLSYADRWDRSELTGILTTNDKDFRLSFNDLFPNDPYTGLSIEISTRAGAQIKEISYINVDRWGASLIESITRLIISSLLFS